MSASPVRKKCVPATEANRDQDRGLFKHAEILERIANLQQAKRSHPPSNPGADEEVDKLCLMQAFHGVAVSLACEIAVFAEHYYVPEDALTEVITDWLVSKKMGVDLLPIEYFNF